MLKLTAKQIDRAWHLCSEIERLERAKDCDEPVSTLIPGALISITMPREQVQATLRARLEAAHQELAAMQIELQPGD